jgi:chromate transporter
VDAPRRATNSTTAENGERDDVRAVPFRDALRVWTHVGLNSFGGPAGQIAVMHRVIVEEKRWISEERFLHALNFCMLLPGPEAQQLSVYIGWLLHKTRGGLVAGLLFILPGCLAMMGLSVLYAGYHDLSFVAGVFAGIKPAVLAIVVDAVLRIGKRALRTRFYVGLAAAAFVGIFLFGVPFPWIVLATGIVGFVVERVRLQRGAASDARAPTQHAEHGGELPTSRSSSRSRSVHTSKMRTARVLAIGLFVWFAPLLIARAWLGGEHVLVQEGFFFSKTAVVTFGGAYAVLSYVAQQAVDAYHWLAPGEMLDGLGLAETTPGPLILVVQFVGFLGAFRHSGALNPMLAGVLGACTTLWATFVPCFLWIFLGAPYVEALRSKPALSSALTAITAAVVGVILNLAVWFALHTLFAGVDERQWGALRFFVPEWSTLSWPALAIALAAMIAMFRFRVGMLWVIAASALAGLVLTIRAA